MKIIAFDNFNDPKPHLRDEVSDVWRLWKAGIVRETATKSDQRSPLLRVGTR